MKPVAVLGRLPEQYDSQTAAQATKRFQDLERANAALVSDAAEVRRLATVDFAAMTMSADFTHASAGSYLKLPFDMSLELRGSGLSIDAVTNRIVCLSPGWYHISGFVTCASSTGIRRCVLYCNSTATNVSDIRTAGTATTAAFTISYPRKLSVNEYLELWAYQPAASLVFGAADSVFSVRRLIS